MGTSRPTVTLPNSKRLDDSSNNENNNKSVISNSNKNNERNDDYEATVDQGAASKAADKSRPPPLQKGQSSVFIQAEMQPISSSTLGDSRMVHITVQSTDDNSITTKMSQKMTESKFIHLLEDATGDGPNRGGEGLVRALQGASENDAEESSLGTPAPSLSGTAGREALAGTAAVMPSEPSSAGASPNPALGTAGKSFSTTLWRAPTTDEVRDCKCT